MAVVLAEFDIDKGSTVRCWAPEDGIDSASDNVAAFAELMLPEGSHHREQDWTYAIAECASSGPFTVTAPLAGAAVPKGDGTAGCSSSDHMLHVFSMVQSRKDASRKRGSNVKAVALAAPFQWLSTLRPALEILLDELFAANSAMGASASADEWSIDARAICARFQASISSFMEAIAADTSPTRLSHDWLQRMAMRAARVHPGLSHGASSAGRAAEEAARARPRWAFATQHLRLPGSATFAATQASNGPSPAAKPSPAHLTPAAGGTPSSRTVQLLLDRTLEPSCSPAGSVSALVAAFAGAAPAILTAAMAGRRVLFVGGKGVSAGDVATLVLATACTLERALPGTLGRAKPSASLTDLGFLECEGGYIAGVSNPLFVDRSAWWDALCLVEAGTVTVKDEVALPEHGAGSVRALARAVLRLAASEAAETLAVSPGALAGAQPAAGGPMELDVDLELDSGASAAGGPPAQSGDADAAARHSEPDSTAVAVPSSPELSLPPALARGPAVRTSSAEPEDPLEAALPRGSWRGQDVALASRLRSGARFGEAWLAEAASSSCEAVCACLDGAVVAARRACGTWVAAAAQGAVSTGTTEPGEAPEDEVLRCAVALPPLAMLNSPRLVRVAASAAYARRRWLWRLRRSQEVALHPTSSFAQACAPGATSPQAAGEAVAPAPAPAPPVAGAGTGADASPLPPPTGAVTPTPSTPGDPVPEDCPPTPVPSAATASAPFHALCDGLDSPGSLRRLGSAASRSLRTLRRAVSDGATLSPSDLVPTAALRRALATLLVACSRSQRDTLHLSAALPESAGGLLPLALPLLHRSVPVKAFSAALLQAIEASSAPYVSARTGSLNAALLGALERARPLASVALESRELEAVVAELKAEPGSAETGGAGAADLAPFNPTSAAGIEAAVALLRLTPADTLLDVGCGDGRVLVEACLRTGCAGVGVESDQGLVDRALSLRGRRGLTDRLRIVCGDATKMDLAALGATAVFVYLVPEGLRVVWPALQPLLDGGVRAASYVFRAPGASVLRQARLGPVSVYLYGPAGADAAVGV